MGLLDDMDDVLNGMDAETAYLNSEKSKIKDIIKIGAYSRWDDDEKNDVIKAEMIDGKKSLVINAERYNIDIFCNKDHKLYDELYGVEYLKTNSGVRIYMNDQNGDLTDSICKNIFVDKYIEVICNTGVLKNAHLTCGSVTKQPILIRNNSEKFTISNSSFEFNNDTSFKNGINAMSDGLVIFNNRIPVFNNITSDNIKTIVLQENAFAPKPMISLDNAAFGKIFENRYELQYSINGVNKKCRIGNMSDIERLAATRNRNTKNRIFSECPIKLKKGAKLSDLIDISGFKNLCKFQILSGRINIMFIKHGMSTNNAFYTKFKDYFLKKDDDVLLSIPVTADGYDVIICQR